MLSKTGFALVEEKQFRERVIYVRVTEVIRKFVMLVVIKLFLFKLQDGKGGWK